MQFLTLRTVTMNHHLPLMTREQIRAIDEKNVQEVTKIIMASPSGPVYRTVDGVYKGKCKLTLHKGWYWWDVGCPIISEEDAKELPLQGDGQ
jgi:hypothetical protein